MKPVLYLDIDGVLWDVTETGTFKGSNGLEEFMTFAFEHFEVRWLTTWGHFQGCLDEKGLETLSNFTKLPIDLWKKVKPNLGWEDLKTEGINWPEHVAGRRFVWVEDGLLPAELQILAERGFLDCYIHTDIFDDPDALIKTHEKLKSRA